MLLNSYAKLAVSGSFLVLFLVLGQQQVVYPTVLGYDLASEDHKELPDRVEVEICQGSKPTCQQTSA